MKRGPNRAKRRAREQRLRRILAYREAIVQSVITNFTKRLDARIMTAFYNAQSASL